MLIHNIEGSMSIEEFDRLVQLLVEDVGALAEKAEPKFDIVSDIEELLVLIDIHSIFSEAGKLPLLHITLPNFL